MPSGCSSSKLSLLPPRGLPPRWPQASLSYFIHTSAQIFQRWRVFSSHPTLSPYPVLVLFLALNTLYHGITVSLYFFLLSVHPLKYKELGTAYWHYSNRTYCVFNKHCWGKEGIGDGRAQWGDGDVGACGGRSLSTLVMGAGMGDLTVRGRKLTGASLRPARPGSVTDGRRPALGIDTVNLCTQWWRLPWGLKPEDFLSSTVTGVLALPSAGQGTITSEGSGFLIAHGKWVFRAGLM